MSLINTSKKQFDAANKQLTNDLRSLSNVNQEIQALLEKKATINAQCEQDTHNRIVKGMLYYDASKRKALLDKAEALKYSRQTLDRLRSYNDDMWNEDNVNNDIISDFEAVEKYVDDNAPAWEKSFLAKLGNLSNRNV